MDKFIGGDSTCLGVKTPRAIADPSIEGVAVKFPSNRYTQDETTGALTDFAGRNFGGSL